MLNPVMVYYLEQLSPRAIRSKPAPQGGLTLIDAEIPSADLQRFLYGAVGKAWQWTDRAAWTDAQWLEVCSKPEFHTTVAYLRGTPVGYFNLEQVGGSVEIQYFGLLPQFLGHQLGGWLLTQALERAWALPGVTRVWVHTCTLDHPAALANYQARGMQLYTTELAEKSARPNTSS